MGRRFEVTVGPVAHGGHCVARHEGRVVFVRHTLPGERVVAEVTEDRHARYCRADAVEVLTAAPERVERPCPYSGPGRCGGCDWQHVSHAGQLALKAAVVREQLSRLAGLDLPVTVEVTGVVGVIRSKVPVMPLSRSSVMVPTRGPKFASLNGANTGSSCT